MVASKRMNRMTVPVGPLEEGLIIRMDKYVDSAYHD